MPSANSSCNLRLGLALPSDVHQGTASTEKTNKKGEGIEAFLPLKDKQTSHKWWVQSSPAEWQKAFGARNVHNCSAFHSSENSVGLFLNIYVI